MAPSYFPYLCLKGKDMEDKRQGCSPVVIIIAIILIAIVLVAGIITIGIKIWPLFALIAVVAILGLIFNRD